MCWRPTRRRPSRPQGRAAARLGGPCQLESGAGGPRPASLAVTKGGRRWRPRSVVYPGYLVLLVVALLAAVVDVPGATCSLPLASTALQAAGSCSSVSGGFAGVGGPGGPGGRLMSAIQSVSSLPQPSSLGGSG